MQTVNGPADLWRPIVGGSDDGHGREGGLRLRLDIWHPDCWTLEVTEEVDAGLLGHGVHDVDGQAQGRFTAYADSAEVLEDLLVTIRESALTDWVWVIDQSHGFGDEALIPGSTFCGLVVAYEERNSISGPLVRRGFLPDAPVRMHGGREYWPVVVNADRDTVDRRLEGVRAETGADIEVQHVSPAGENIGQGIFWHDALSARQREVLVLARLRGYYRWPREVTVGELADELDIAKPTLLEHLRKAEAKLLDAGPG